MNEKDNSEKDLFVSRLLRHLDKVVVPVMKKIGERIKDDGYDYGIALEDFPDRAQRWMQKKVMSVFPIGYNEDDSTRVFPKCSVSATIGQIS